MVRGENSEGKGQGGGSEIEREGGNGHWYRSEGRGGCEFIEISSVFPTEVSLFYIIKIVRFFSITKIVRFILKHIHTHVII